MYREYIKRWVRLILGGYQSPAFTFFFLPQEKCRVSLLDSVFDELSLRVGHIFGAPMREPYVAHAPWRDGDDGIYDVCQIRLRSGK